jgi:hypothetical protein
MDRPYTIYCNFCGTIIKDDSFGIVCDCDEFLAWQEKRFKEWEELEKKTVKENPDISGFKSEAF